MKRFKFLRTNFKSENGNTIWKIGQWQIHDGELEMCERGFHCSKTIYQAFSYVQGEILAEVEVKGKSIKQDDKEVWTEMRVVRAWKWQKKDSVVMAIFCAEQVIGIFEQQYPSDDRPRKAIEAAKEWLEKPTEKNMAAAARDAAWAAWAAGAAWDAGDAARAAARAAGAAARDAAGDAAWDAARAARAAARDAAGNAGAAAGDATIKKITKWMDQQLKELEEI